MSRTGLVFLICALSTAVFGFGADSPPAWTVEKLSSVFFLVLAAVSLFLSNLRRPSPLWEVLDEFRGQRGPELRLSQTHGMKGRQHD